MNIEKINFGRNTVSIGQRIVHNSVAMQTYGISMPAALTQDCVTFTGKNAKKDIQALQAVLILAEKKAAELEEETCITAKELPAEQKIWKINKKDAKRIHNAILKPQGYIKTFIHNLFDDLIYNEKNPRNPILELHDRPKTVDSIIEKAATLKLKSIDEVMNTITDLNGAKIVFRKKAGKDEVDFALDRFIPMIKTGQFELSEIEIKLPFSIKTLPKKEQEKYIYSSISMLKRLVEVQQNYWNTKNTAIENIRRVQFTKPQYYKGNYCAIHMLGDLPNKDARIFEIQIMGAYVGAGKDLDDILFKLINGKEVKKQYKPIANLYNNLKEDTTGALDRFLQYRKDANLALREREIQEAKNNKTTGKNVKLFISAESYNLPPEYDLNNLMTLKKDCDRKAAIAEKNLEEARKAKQEKEKAAQITEEQTEQRKHFFSWESLSTIFDKFNPKHSKKNKQKKKF